MKIIRTLLIVIIVIVALGLILMLVAPTGKSYSKSIIINAPKEVVWANISTLEKLNEWGPWKDKDTNIVTSIEGTDGTIGAKASWEGNREVGKGSQTISKLDPMNRMETHLAFVEPMAGQAEAFIQMDDTADAVNVTWGFSMEMPRPFNVFGLFMSMEKEMGDEYSAGLNSLKTMCESEANKTYRGYKITEVEQPARIFVGKRSTVTFPKMADYFGTNFPLLMEFAKGNMEITGPPCGMFWTYDTVAQNSDMAVAVPVKEWKQTRALWQQINVDAGTAAQLEYSGNYDQAEQVYMALHDYSMEKYGADKPRVSVEEYLAGPGSEPDTAKWLTRIYYYVK